MASQPLPNDDPESTLGGGFIFGHEQASALPARQALPPRELLARLSALMQSFEGCESVTVIETTRLDAPDTEGCNWSSSIVLQAAGVAPEVYSLAYASVIATARAQWNLA